MKKMLDWLRSSPAIDPRSLRLPASAALDERPLSAQRMVVVDLETSGLNLQRDQLLAIGAVVIEDGAIDFIQKPINEERLLSAVAKAVRYDETHRGWTISEEEEKKRFQTLTSREKQILSLIAKGLINKEVSERLGLSPRTIEVHRQKGLHKLGVQTVSELVRLLSHIEENALF